MTRITARGRIFLALLALGAFSQVAQAMLVRESLVAFYGNEVSLGAFFGTWLFWIAVGSLIVVYAWRRGWAQQPQQLLPGLLLLLSPLLALQILLIRVARLFLDVSATEFMALGDLFAAVFLITAPTGLVIGLAFPLACKVLDLHPRPHNGEGPARAVANVSWLYIVQAIGALAGGVLFTFALIEGLGTWRSLGVTAALLALASALLGAGSGWQRVPQALVGLLGLALATTPLGGWLESRMEEVRFTVMQPALTLVDAVETRYGHVAVARHGEQTSIVVDGRVTESYPLENEVRQRAAYLYAQAVDPRRVLMFGGLAGGLAEELLRYPVETVTVVEQDRVAFERLRPHLMPSTRRALKDPRLNLQFIDGRRFANRLRPGADFDLVLVLGADPSSADDNRYFTLEFYRQLGGAMDPEGVICTEVSSASNYLGSEVASYAGSVYRTLSEVFPQVAIQPGDDQLFCASRARDRVSEDPAELERRYLELQPEQRRISAITFFSLLPPERIAFVREQLESRGGALNTDTRPVTYYLNMVLWGKFSASQIVHWLDRLGSMGVWPYLVPVLLFTVLLMLRASSEGYSRPRSKRYAATFTLALLGMIAMAAQLAILFAYQAQVGFVFSRIALLNGLFMTGLALGAGGLGQWLARGRHADLSLMVLMGLVAIATAFLPFTFGQFTQLGGTARELAFLALCTGAGLLTGTGFPLGVHQAHQDTDEVLRSSGLAEAADDLGGALGGLLTGALLVPVLGITGTSQLLSLLAVIALVPLLHARYAPTNPQWLKTRGQSSFPWSRTSWVLLFLVANVGILAALARGAAPGPVLEFSESALREVSGSEDFARVDTPEPHYLGYPSERQPSTTPDTVSLSTMAAASDVRGYAGPINLLVSVDTQGILRGVRYVHSNETPAYVEGIESWLAGLSGRDLSREPLTPDRYDVLSGATVSSQAALEAVDRTATAGSLMAFGRSLGDRQPQPREPPWTQPAFLLTLALLLAFFPVYRSGNDRWRLVYQLAALAVLGLHLNALFTEVDLLNLTQGHFSSWSENPQRWLLLGFVLLTAVLFGPAWCGYVCPFGALQELLSRLGRRLYLRRYVSQELDQVARYLKYLLLAAMLILVWVTGNAAWGGFDPMQHLFGGHLGGWVGAIILVSLVGSVVYVRFWCRYFCPVGALLALFNKLALLDRFAPKRRFDHCDLGVRHDFDVDCIRCQRCLSGRDYGIRHKRSRDAREIPSLGIADTRSASRDTRRPTQDGSVS